MKDREYTKEQLIKELEESSQTNEFLSLLLKSMPVAVYTCEAGGDFGATYISNNITALTGYRPHDFTSHSEFWFDNVHPNDKEMVNENLATLLVTGDIAYEYRWRVADGSYKWFYDISKLMKAQSGKSNYIIGTFIDITERKKTEEALKTSEEKYRFLFSTEQDAMIIVNAETGRIVDANDAAFLLYGYSKEEILKLTGPELSAEPEESDAAISKVAMSNDKQIHYHTRNHKKKDGTVFPVEISSGIFILKDRKFISAMIRDITERKAADDKLRKSEEKYRNLVNSLQEGIWAIDKYEKTSFINEKMAEMLGYTADEMLGKSVFDFMDKRGKEICEKKIEQRKNGVKEQHDFELLKKDGSRVYVTMESSPIYDENGEYIGGVAGVIDITKRRQAEEALQNAHNELEMKVKKRTTKLETTVKLLQDEIKKRNRAEKQVEIYQNQLRTLISKVSVIEEHERKLIAEELHDNIGQYLAITKINLSKLRKSYPIIANDLDETREWIEQAIKFTRSLTFDLGNPILYQMGFKPAVEWLTDNIQKTHGIQVEIVADKKISNITEEVSVFLFKAVRELLMNIVKHAQAKKSIVSISNKGSKIQVIVEDNGIGLDTSKIISKSVNNQSIGIFSIRERINHLGGAFEIKSKEGQGTRIKLVVPRK